MAKIKIRDLPKDMKVSDEEMKKIAGGYASTRLLGARGVQSYSVFPNLLPGRGAVVVIEPGTRSL